MNTKTDAQNATYELIHRVFQITDGYRRAKRLDCMPVFERGIASGIPDLLLSRLKQMRTALPAELSHSVGFEKLCSGVYALACAVVAFNNTHDHHALENAIDAAERRIQHAAKLMHDHPAVFAPGGTLEGVN